MTDDTLIVTFDNTSHDSPILLIARPEIQLQGGPRINVLKKVIGEEAIKMHEMLTDQFFNFDAPPIKKEEATKRDDSGWDFHWDGRGSYEESRRAFYGEFS